MTSRRERLLQIIEETEYNREVLPHFGMISDFMKVYEDMRDIILEEDEQGRT